MASATARARRLRIAPRKVRLVADLIRGKTVAQARDILRFTPKNASSALSKLLDSAAANAENAAVERHERIDADEMMVRRIQVNQGPTGKRFRYAPRGQGVRIRKRTSHVDILISDVTT